MNAPNERPNHRPHFPHLLTIEDVADALQISKRTVETLLSLQKLPRPLRLGRQRRWTPDAIKAFIDALPEDN